jgi:hypothetical protein
MKTLFFLLLGMPSLVCAGARTSANYTIAADTLDSGGKHTASSNYSCDGSTGLVAGISSVATPVEVAKTGYIGQLYEFASLQVSATPGTVDERATRQLAATAVMDDATTLTLVPDQVAWSESSAALTGISSGGLVTAASVYQNEIATVNGTCQSVTDTDGFNLTVVNITDDDFGTYAADGIDDDWQVGYFGQPPNANAAPTADPDADQQDNEFEFLSGFSPTDPLAFFKLTMTAVNRVAGTADLQLNRVIPDRTYTLKSSPDLVTAFAFVGTLPAVEEPETDVTIRDTTASGARNFYIIEIGKH